MKIHNDHYAYMRDVIGAIPRPRFEVIKANVKSDKRVQDQAKRLRWDLLYSAGLTKWICDNLYSYADDSHIDTALRAIVSSLNLAI
jgi:hypothetical protein